MQKILKREAREAENSRKDGNIRQISNSPKYEIIKNYFTV